MRRLAAAPISRLEPSGALAGAGQNTSIAHLFHLYDGDAKDFIAASLYHFLGWAVGAVEVYVFLSLIGAPVSWMDALIIETMIQPITAAGVDHPGCPGGA